MHSLGRNDGELRWQPANRGSPGKMAFKTVCVSEVIVEKISVLSVSCELYHFISGQGVVPLPQTV